MNMAVPALRYYREAFVPSATLSQPLAMLAVSIITAENEQDLEGFIKSSDLSMVRLITGRFGPIPSPEEALAYSFNEFEIEQLRPMRNRRLMGTPAEVKAKIDALVAETGADEVMISSMIWGHQNRLHSLELMADQFQLQGMTLAGSVA
jgi:alkanesulfonate monooxygenase SsuD/methylene tetrahydromethanopterin reductase-like flavin-dependent oxidoreductase (luciferase family)